ncbi:MAG: 2'-5' RNA ligase family protein [Cyanobacteria bacterium P01_D01_bin.156]
MVDSHYFFWLVPQSPDLEDFQGIINSLAKRFNTVPFSPHVTLYSGWVPSEVDLRSVLAELAAMPALELDILGLCHTDRFAQTLYVHLQQSPILSQLVRRLVKAIPKAQLPALDPHVSLLYHSLDTATKQQLIGTISLSRPTIRFNQVQAIAAPQNFETQAHVSSLRRVHSQFLTTRFY